MSSEMVGTITHRVRWRILLSGTERLPRVTVGDLTGAVGRCRRVVPVCTSSRASVHGGNRSMESRNAAPAAERTPRLWREPLWTDRMVSEAGIEVRDKPFVSVGGGIGSMCKQ